MSVQTDMLTLCFPAGPVCSPLEGAFICILFYMNELLVTFKYTFISAGCRLSTVFSIVKGCVNA